MENHNIWKSSVQGIRRFIPRMERGNVVLPVLLKTAEKIRLIVKGVVKKVYLNGTLLKQGKEGFWVPKNILKPWENEILLCGWPETAWLKAEGERQYPCEPKQSAKIRSENDLLKQAGYALCAFIVKEGPDAGDMFSFYDPVDHTFRMPRWRWDTGICLEALCGLARRTDDPILKNDAGTVTKRLLAVQLNHPECPGGFPEAADPHMTPAGLPVLPEWVVPFNGAFIGAGLMATGDILSEKNVLACFSAAKRSDEMMLSHGITPEGILRGYYHVREQQWRYHGQINDSGIYPRLGWLLAEKGYSVNTGAILNYAKVISQWIQPEGYIGRARFYPDDPVWPVGPPLFPEWKKHPSRIPAKIFARGQAWGILGLNSAWRLTEDKQILNSIRRVADYLIAHQDKSGLWHHDLRQLKLGTDIKGTAVIGWALLESRQAYEAAGGDIDKMMKTVYAAWEALKNNQKHYLSGPIPGALCDEGEEGAIIYYRNRPMYTAYATAAFILFGLSLEQIS